MSKAKKTKVAKTIKTFVAVGYDLYSIDSIAIGRGSSKEKALRELSYNDGVDCVKVFEITIPSRTTEDKKIPVIKV